VATRLFHLDTNIVSFNFLGSLIVAQFTIFGRFSGLELLEPFLGPKRRFYGKRRGHYIPKLSQFSFVLIFNIFEMSYYDSQTKIICQSYAPSKLMYHFTQMGPIVLVLHVLGLGFWMSRVFHCFSIINVSSSLIVT